MILKNITGSERQIVDKLGNIHLVQPGNTIEIIPKDLPGTFNSFKEFIKLKRGKSKRLKQNDTSD